MTGHDGIFAVERRRVADYCAKFDPQPLRYNRTYTDIAGRPINFGASKGMTFDRTLIYGRTAINPFSGANRAASTH